MKKKIFLIVVAVLFMFNSFSMYIVAEGLEEKKINFLINGDEIKEGYNDFVEMNIQIPDTLFEEETEIYLLQKNKRKKINSDWKQVNNTFITSISFFKEGNYSVEVILPKKEISYVSNEFTIDEQRPNIIFKMGTQESQTLPNFLNNKEKLEIFFQDKNLKKEMTSVFIFKDGKSIYREQGKKHFVYNLKEEGTYIFQVYGEDKAGNSIYYTNEDFPLHVDLKKPDYRFTDGTKLIQKNTVFYTQQDVYVEVTDLNFHKDKSKVYVNEQELAGEWIKKENVWKMKIPCFSSGKYTLGVSLEDQAGNVVENLKALQFEVDTLPPDIEMRLNDQKIEHFSNYYNKEQRLDFIVRENHLDKEKSAFIVNGKKIPWKKINTCYQGEVILKDGIYEVAYELQDKGGHKVEYTYSKFIIDSTNPEVISNDNKIRDFENKPIHMQYRIKEPNIDMKKSKLYCLQNNSKEEIPVKWKKDVFWHAEVDIVEDGAYDLVFEIWDLAGNQTVIKPNHFVLDTTPYKVFMKVNGLEVNTNHIYKTNQKVNFSFSWDDAYPDMEELWLLHDNRKTKVPLKNGSFEWEAIPSKENTSSYVFYLTLKDKAGNTTHKEFQIVLDSLLVPPQIENDVFHGAPYSGSWQPKLKGENKDFKILNYVLLRNQKIYPYQWGTEIKEDGYYELHVYVQDDAQNQKGLLQPFRFEIDTTAPKLVILDEDGNIVEQNVQIKRKKLQLSIVSEDDVKDEKITSLYINGIKQELDNSQNYVFLPDTGLVKVEAQAQDAAGNISTYTWQGYILENNIKKKILSVPKNNEIIIVTTFVMMFFVISCGLWIWKKHEN